MCTQAQVKKMSRAAAQKHHLALYKVCGFIWCALLVLIGNLTDSVWQTFSGWRRQGWRCIVDLCLGRFVAEFVSHNREVQTQQTGQYASCSHHPGMKLIHKHVQSHCFLCQQRTYNCSLMVDAYDFKDHNTIKCWKCVPNTLTASKTMYCGRMAGGTPPAETHISV